ncbi:MAG: type II secretion system protein GspN [Syntrophales bacterium]
MRFKINRAIVGYPLAGIVLLLVFLYLRFPGEALTDYLKAAVAARYPGAVLSIGTLRPSFPPGVALADITIGMRDRTDVILRLDSLTVRPGGLAPFRGRLAIHAAAEGYGGEVQGKAEFSRLLSLRGPLTAAVEIRNLRIDRWTWLRDIFVRQVTGTLKGAVAFSGTAEALKNGTGTVDFTLTNGVYPLQESFLGLDKIEYSRVEGKASFRNGALKVTQLTLTGEKIRCSLKGNILLADDFPASKLDLNGTIELPLLGNKRVTLTIDGTIGNPRSRVM